ncbi:MAG: NAD(P)/FAD-dependent oxidoreductase [Deltaproteobacteria bacterium]|nr:NAD(P)/FAD-dependent oxidoreductase [Deltaproteobacteria bacterium]
MLKKTLTRRSFLTVSAMTAATLALDWKKISAYAAKMGPLEKYPTVVIGAGLGGLTCAAYLARQGIPVTLLEQHEIPGGYATSFDRAGGKFTFEVSLHGTSIHDNAPARILSEVGVLDKLQLVELPEVYRLKTPDMEIPVPQRNPEGYIRLALQYPKMWKVRNMTLADLLDRHVQNEKLKETLSALWGYYGLPPSKLSGFYYATATGGYLKNGSYHIKHRSQDLSYLMAEAVEKAGGTILYETAAEKIQLKNGAVAGVATSKGETLPARAVVSNASALTTLGKMLPENALPSEYMNKLKSFRPSISSFIVWLGLNEELRGKIPGFSTHVSSGRGPEADYAAGMAGDIEKGSFSVSIYDNVFEGYSQPGTSTLMLLFLCGYQPWKRFEDDYGAGRKNAYRREKERWADVLIKKAEKQVIPGLSSMIEVREAATPLTNRRYTRNPEGAIYGFEQSMDNAFMNRIENRTPIKGLYLASAWGSPGGGFTGVFRGGELAFQEMMEDWGG